MKCKKYGHLAPKIKELSKNNTMQECADILGITFNQTMYVANTYKITFIKRGSAHYATTLDESDIPLIRQLFDSGIKKHIIAKKFDVNVPVIEKILRGENWSHAI